VANATHHWFSAGLFDHLFDSPAATQVVEDRCAGNFFKKRFRDQCGDDVHGDIVAVFVEKARAVSVAVKGDAEGIVTLFEFGGNGVEGFESKRVGFVVRECAVEFVVHRGDVEHGIGEHAAFENAHAIGIVDQHIDRLFDLRKRTDMLEILGLDVVFRNRAGRCGGLVKRLFVDDTFDIRNASCAGDRNRQFAANFHSVPFAGVMRGRDDHGAVCAKLAVGVVGHRRGSQTNVDHINALHRQAFSHCIKKRDGVRTHVVSDYKFLRLQERRNRAPNFEGDLVGQLGTVDAADVVCFENSSHGFSPVSKK